jgi:hypothetical protein
MKLSAQLLIGLLLIITAFIAGTCSNSRKGITEEIEHTRREKALHERIADLNREKEIIAQLGNAYRDTLDSVRTHYVRLLERKESKVTNIKKRVTKLKADTTSYPTICARKDSIILAYDTLVSELEGEAAILKEEKRATWNSFNKILEAEHEEKAMIQQESDEYKEAYELTEIEYQLAKKKEKRAKRGRNLLIVIGLILGGMVAIK